MRLAPRKALTAAAALALLAVLSGRAVAAPDEDRGAAPPVGLPLDPRHIARLRVLDEAIAAREWERVAALLEQLLAAPDAYVPVPAEGAPRLVAVRDAALRRLHALPPDGLAAYRAAAAEAARKELGDAVAARDAARLIAAAARHPLTEAADDALLALGTLLAEAGHPHLAARTFVRLGDRRPLARWPDEAVLAAAAAYRRAGAADHAAPFAAEVARRGDDDLARRLAASLADDAVFTRAAAKGEGDARVAGADLVRSNQGRGGPPRFEALWRRDTARTLEVQDWLAQARRQADGRCEAALPAAVPVAVTRAADGVRLVVYRDYWGLRASSVERGVEAWIAYSHWSPDRMVRDSVSARELVKWMDGYAREKRLAAAIHGNSTVGTLSSDGKFLFAVEGLAVSPPSEDAARVSTRASALSPRPPCSHFSLPDIRSKAWRRLCQPASVAPQRLILSPAITGGVTSQCCGRPSSGSGGASSPRPR